MVSRETLRPDKSCKLIGLTHLPAVVLVLDGALTHPTIMEDRAVITPPR
jgi:hypothetical protein